MIWHSVPFESLYAEPSRNGINRPRRVRGSGYKMINMGEIFAYDRIKNPPMELVPLSAQEIDKYGIHEGDLLFARQSLVASGAGKCSIVLDVPEITTFEGHLIRVRMDKSKVNPLFYFYYFSSFAGMGNIQSLVMQVAAAGIRGSELAKLNVPYPPLQIQNKIATALSTYDDLIEKNTRSMELLEESMRLLYREFFVHLRFPGYERVKIIDGIPDGWEKTVIDDAFKTLGGGTPSKKVDDYWVDGSINWYTPSDLTKKHLVFMEESSTKTNIIGISKSSAKLFPPYSVMMTSRATIGEISINTTEASTNQGFITCIPNERVPLYFLYHWLSDNVPVFLGLATGATFKEITKGVFRKLPILIPQNRLLEEFEKTVSTTAELVLNLQRQNIRLVQARDELLARLMNGSIPV